MSTLKFQHFLDQARIAPEIFKLRPDYRALLVIVEGIQAQASDDLSERMLVEAEASAKAALGTQPVIELPHIAAWREAYKAFGAKPTKFRNSLEALTRRADAGLPRVNRLTDIYNAISVKYQIPFGGEDLDKYTGGPFLIRAIGTEDFVSTAAGEQITEHPDAGEVVWCDDAGVTCRRWNWRQGPRTALSDQTTSVLFILDALEPASEDRLNEAVDELLAALKSSSADIRSSRRLLQAHK